MPEDIPPTPSPAPVPEPGTEPPPSVDLGPGPGINIAEEFGTAKRNLPPAKIVAIVLGAAAILLGIYAFMARAKPQGGGSVDNITAVEVPDQNMVMVAINVTVHNSGEKSLWIHDIKGRIATDSGELSDEAASPMDFDRYFQAFPALKEHALAPHTAGDENSARRPGSRHDRGDLPRNQGRLRQTQISERGDPALRSAPAAGADQIRESPRIHTDFHGSKILR